MVVGKEEDEGLENGDDEVESEDGNAVVVVGTEFKVLAVKSSIFADKEIHQR